jgi:hypothetical protein
MNRFVVAGQKVEFEPVDSNTGPQAHHVRKIAVTIAIQRYALLAGGERR